MKRKRKFNVVGNDKDGYTLQRPFVIFSKAYRTVTRTVKSIPDSNGVQKEVLLENKIPIRGNRKSLAFTVDDTGRVVMSFARCSSKDQFCRYKGRSKVVGRLHGYMTHNKGEYIFDTNLPQIENIINELKAYGSKKYPVPNISFSIPLDMLEYVYNVSCDFVSQMYDKSLNKITNPF